MGDAPRIAMVAGEASADLLAAHLMAAIKTRHPGARFMGIGGPRMVAEGFEAWWPGEKLAVRGYVEVLRHYHEITSIRRQLAQRLEHATERERPHLFIGVDAPDFNLALETRLRRGGLRTCHYVSPSIWAWRGGRVDKIRAAVDHMLCLFPFEPALYAKAGISASYVGHPLADLIGPDAGDAAARTAARAALGLPQEAVLVALLPGSRQSELRYLAPRFIGAAQRLAQQRPALHFVVPFASAETELLWRAAQAAAGAGQAGAAVTAPAATVPAAHAGIPSGTPSGNRPGTATGGLAATLPITLVQRASHQALAACDVALVASGTATLEAALLRRPMVIAYNMAPLSWALMRRMQYQPWVGLPNILCGQFVVPELLQDDATADNLAQALGNLLDDARLRRRIAARFATLHAELRQDSATRAADAVDTLLRA